MAATLCKRLGSRLYIEPNIFSRLSELEDYISSYYNVQKFEFVDSNNQIVLGDLVYVNKTFCARLGKILWFRPNFSLYQDFIR